MELLITEWFKQDIYNNITRAWIAALCVLLSPWEVSWTSKCTLRIIEKMVPSSCKKISSAPICILMSTQHGPTMPGLPKWNFSPQCWWIYYVSQTVLGTCQHWCVCMWGLRGCLARNWDKSYDFVSVKQIFNFILLPYEGIVYSFCLVYC